MPLRGKLKADQLHGYPGDPTKFLAGEVDTDGSNKWLTPAGTGVSPQNFPNVTGEFLDSYDSSTGLFTASTPPGGGGGGLVFLQRATASSSSSLDLASWYSSTYDTYMIVIQGITLSTSANIRLRVSTDGGSTYVSSSSYVWSFWYHYPAGTGNISTGVLPDGIYMRDTATTLATRGTFDARFLLHNPGGSNNKLFQGETSTQVSGATPLMMQGGGYYDSATAVNGIRLEPTTGNFPVGSMTIYGLAKA